VEIGLELALSGSVGCVSVDGRGLLAGFRGSFRPASEREVRMDDHTLRRENDAGNEKRLSGPLTSGRGPIFQLNSQ